MIILLATLTSGVYAASNISIMYGNKSLDKGDWEPVESQTEFGLGFEYQKPEWPAALVVTYLSSEDSETISGIKLTGETTELGIGARKYLVEDRARFFVEGGLANISADVSVSAFGVTVSESDSTIGFWLGAGMDFMVGDAFSIGFLGRLSNASVTLFGVDAEAGGTHLGVFAAYHFD